MKALQASIDGEIRWVAGHRNFQHLDFLFMLDSKGTCRTTVVLTLEHDEPKSAGHGYWLDLDLEEDQELSLRIIDTDAPDPLSKFSPRSHQFNKEGVLELSCSFCGRVNSDVEKLVTGANGNICEECTAHAHEIMKSLNLV